MTTVIVNTNSPEVIVNINGSAYYFPKSTSRADYSGANDSLVLNCTPIGLKLPFPSSSYDFIIDSVPYVGTFASLAIIFNETYFDTTSISPPPVLPAVTIRANAITTGAYVATTEVKVTGRRLLNVDFIITDGGALANNGNIIAILEASDDNLNWVSVHNVAVNGNLHQDGATTPYEAGTVFRNMSAEIPAYAIPYDGTNPPVNPIRLSFATGYGLYYRFKIRASVASGIQGGAPATFPDLEMLATLQ
jgi:hypothetical protein